MSLPFAIEILDKPDIDDSRTDRELSILLSATRLAPPFAAGGGPLSSVGSGGRGLVAAVREGLLSKASSASEAEMRAGPSSANRPLANRSPATERKGLLEMSLLTGGSAGSGLWAG